MTVKLSPEQITALGGLKDASEFGAKFETLQAKAGKADQMETENKTQASKIDTLTSDLKNLSETVSKLDARVKTVDMDAVKAAAKEAGLEAGSLAATKALGQVGASGAGVVPAQANDGASNASGSAALIEQGKYAEAWAADKSIQDEFSDANAYAGYMKASAAGRVRIYSKN